jgi:hypothetical protein
MTTERHLAFKSARGHIQEIAPAKLFDHERELLDTAAEDLLLAVSDEDAQQALETATITLATLVESERWTPTMRDQLLSLLDACGPRRQLLTV